MAVMERNDPQRTRVTRVQVVDDNAALRALAGAHIAMAPDLELVGEAADGAEAIAIARRDHPDAIILDLEMPVLDGMDALPLLLEAVPGVTIVVHSSHDSLEARAKAVERGASHYCVKGAASLAEVLSIIRERR